MAIDMETIRINCADRMVVKLETLSDLSEATKLINAEHRNESNISHDAATEFLRNKGRRDFSADIQSLTGMVSLVQHAIEADIWFDVEQYVTLLVRDVFKPLAQINPLEPIVMLTGNSMAPTYRAIDKLDDIWQADTNGEYIHELWQMVERKCFESDIYLGTVEDDGSIYAVDTSRWEPSEAAENNEAESIHDEWTAIDPVVKESAYVMDYESLGTAVSVAPDGSTISFRMGQQVKFKQPNHDTGVHTITAIGRDTDLDVWIKLGDDDTPIFDWSSILESAN